MGRVRKYFPSSSGRPQRMCHYCGFRWSQSDHTCRACSRLLEKYPDGDPRRPARLLPAGGRWVKGQWVPVPPERRRRRREVTTPNHRAIHLEPDPPIPPPNFHQVIRTVSPPVPGTIALSFFTHSTRVR